ncbi:MAG: hypothetical protein MZV64_71700 [Ignavibacteriales bacterium]|nr:hypothetical protein [Ignavibacteriales bacterium]
MVTPSGIRARHRPADRGKRFSPELGIGDRGVAAIGCSPGGRSAAG